MGVDLYTSVSNYYETIKYLFQWLQVLKVS